MVDPTTATAVNILKELRRNGSMQLRDLQSRVYAKTYETFTDALQRLLDDYLIFNITISGTSAFVLANKGRSDDWEKKIPRDLFAIFGSKVFHFKDARCQYVLFSCLAAHDNFEQRLAACDEIKGAMEGLHKYRVVLSI